VRCVRGNQGDVDASGGKSLQFAKQVVDARVVSAAERASRRDISILPMMIDG
jgi:hypothetical protein